MRHLIIASALAQIRVFVADMKNSFAGLFLMHSFILIHLFRAKDFDLALLRKLS